MPAFFTQIRGPVRNFERSKKSENDESDIKNLKKRSNAQKKTKVYDWTKAQDKISREISISLNAHFSNLTACFLNVFC